LSKHNLNLTGSETEIVFEFPGFDDTESPLHGRSTDSTLSAEVLNYAIKKIGWLTLFRAKCRDYNKCNKEIIVNEVTRKVNLPELR